MIDHKHTRHTMPDKKLACLVERNNIGSSLMRTSHKTTRGRHFCTTPFFIPATRSGCLPVGACLLDCNMLVDLSGIKKVLALLFKLVLQV
jgi:hypothetical protein